MAERRKKKKNTRKNDPSKKRVPEEGLEDLRERLYSRGSPPAQRQRRKLKDRKQQAPESWQNTSQKVASESRSSEKKESRPAVSAEVEKQKRDDVVSSTDMPNRSNKKRTIRTRLLVVGGVFFVVALILSIGFLLFGQNTISGDNISINVTGPFVVGGGEEIDLRIAISNQNDVPIESATLIIEYPEGTQVVGEEGSELSRERRSLESIQAGEVLNVPIEAVVFGEENEEKEIQISVEYRVAGSNATFFKEADPYGFQISSSPVVVSVTSEREATSGQEVSFEVQITSNSPNPVQNILVEAEYPSGFEYTEASVEPDSGNNTWRIDTLAPASSQTITIKGVVSGASENEQVFTFRTGVPNERDPFSLASVFSVAREEMTFKQGFIDLSVMLNGSTEASVATTRDDRVEGSITFTNTLSNTIFDGEIQMVLDGNALNESNVRSSGGHYDSTTNTLTWTGRDINALSELEPDDSGSVSFTLEAEQEDIRTPQITFDVSVRGKRVSEDRVPEDLTNTISRAIKFESEVELDGYAMYSTGPFVNTGPTPPVAEEITQYTLFWEVTNGSNDIADAIVSAELPPYVTWLDLSGSGQDVSFNTETREVTWELGDLSARSTEEVAFQVSFLPSTTQVGSVPTILERSQFRATDRFTGTVLTESIGTVNTDLSRDPDESVRGGRVVAEEE